MNKVDAFWVFFKGALLRGKEGPPVLEQPARHLPRQVRGFVRPLVCPTPPTISSTYRGVSGGQLTQVDVYLVKCFYNSRFLTVKKVFRETFKKGPLNPFCQDGSGIISSRKGSAPGMRTMPCQPHMCWSGFLAPKGSNTPDDANSPKNICLQLLSSILYSAILRL